MIGNCVVDALSYSNGRVLSNLIDTFSNYNCVCLTYSTPGYSKPIAHMYSVYLAYILIVYLAYLQS